MTFFLSVKDFLDGAAIADPFVGGGVFSKITHKQV